MKLPTNNCLLFVRCKKGRNNESLCPLKVGINDTLMAICFRCSLRVNVKYVLLIVIESCIVCVEGD